MTLKVFYVKDVYSALLWKVKFCESLVVFGFGAGESSVGLLFGNSIARY